MDGSDRPENLIILCTDSHAPDNHQVWYILYNWLYGKNLLERHNC